MSERQSAEYVAALEKLLATSLELCNHIGTGLEPAGQSMDVTMAQYAVREFRKATGRARRLQIDGLDDAGTLGS